MQLLSWYWPGWDGSAEQVSGRVAPGGAEVVELPEQSCDGKTETMTAPEQDASFRLPPPPGNGVHSPSIAYALTRLASEQSGEEYVPTTTLLLNW